MHQIDQKLVQDSSNFIQFANELDRVKLREHITIAGNIMPALVRPYFLSKTKEKKLQESMEILFGCLEKIIAEFPRNEEIRKIIGLSKDEEKLAMIDPGYRHRHIIIARPDCFFDGDNFRITEFNTDSPAGAGYGTAYYYKALKQVEPMNSWLDKIGAT